ncbi:hypothetical protein D3C78_1394030 [compost metagenome]
MHVIGKHGGTTGFGRRTFQLFLQVVAIKNVVTQHQRAVIATNKLFAQNKGLGQPIRARLYLVLQVQSPLAAISQQLLETGGVLRCADDEDVADPRQHQGAQRVIDHRLVIDRQ